MKNLSARLLRSLFITIFSFLSLSAMAQNSPPPLAEEWEFTPKTGKALEFNAALREHAALRKEHGDPWNWQVFSAYTGDDFGQYVIRYCCANWADFDEYAKWSAENPEVMEHWMTKVNPYIERTRHYFNTIDWENSHWDDEGGPYPLVSVDEWFIKPGQEAQLEEALTRMSQIALNQGWTDLGYNWVWISVIGGQPKVAIAMPHKNFADMAREGENFADFLTRHMGSAEAAVALMQKFADATYKRSTTLWQYHPDLSINRE